MYYNMMTFAANFVLWVSALFALTFAGIVVQLVILQIIEERSALAEQLKKARQSFEVTIHRVTIDVPKSIYHDVELFISDARQIASITKTELFDGSPYEEWADFLHGLNTGEIPMGKLERPPALWPPLTNTGGCV